MADRLGSGYSYETVGKGESDPIARNAKKDGSDNANGRARNRRVEISYTVQQQSLGATTTPQPSAGTGRGGTGQPAAFRRNPGSVVGSIDYGHDDGPLRVDVYPFYRDGKYLVAVFDVVNVGPEQFSYGSSDPFGYWGTSFASGADFGGFSVVDPTSQARYVPVRIQPAGNEQTAFVESDEVAIPPNGQGRARGFVYYPAPPDDVSRVTFELQEVGKLENVPIR